MQRSSRALQVLGLALASFAFSFVAGGATAQMDEAGLRTVLRGTMTKDENDPHLRLSPQWEASEAERQKAHSLVTRLHEVLEPYRNIETAYRAGYVEFPGGEEIGDEVHFVHIERSILENWRLEPSEPGALLYRREADNTLRLVGAMFTAPALASPADLNERVPLGVARWHLHVNLCVPDPIWDERQWSQVFPSGEPLFGPESPVATREDCEGLGGDFHESMFGWMVHVYLDSSDPWGTHLGH